MGEEKWRGRYTKLTSIEEAAIGCSYWICDEVEGDVEEGVLVDGRYHRYLGIASQKGRNCRWSSVDSLVVILELCSNSRRYVFFN